MGLSKQFCYFISALVNKRHRRRRRRRCRSFCCCCYCCQCSTTVASHHIKTSNVIYQSNRLRVRSPDTGLGRIYKWMCFNRKVCGNHFVVVYRQNRFVFDTIITENFCINKRKSNKKTVYCHNVRTPSNRQK